MKWRSAMASLILAGTLAGSATALAQSPGPYRLDPTFDGDGVRVDDFGSDEEARGVAIHADGRIVITGRGCGQDILVVRYTPTGNLDPSFGTGGRTCVDVTTQSPDRGERIFALPDGKVTVAANSAGDFAAIRLNSNGTLDSTFDGDGKAVYDFGAAEQLRDAAMTPDGRVVLAGYTDDDFAGGCPFLPFPANPNFTDSDYVIVRVQTNGALDPTFGNGGRAVVDNQLSRATAVAVQPDGAVVVGGYTTSCTLTMRDYSLFRLTPNGVLDPSFANGPVFWEPGWDLLSDLALGRDGKVVFAIPPVGQGPVYSSQRQGPLLLRVNPDGSPDATFDGDGIQEPSPIPSDILIQPDLKILLAGGGSVLRLNPDGTPDLTFGTNGAVTGIPFGIVALALQPDGRIVATGSSGGNVAVARLSTGSSQPPTGSCSSLAVARSRTLQQIDATEARVLQTLTGPHREAVAAQLQSARARATAAHDAALARCQSNGSASAPTSGLSGPAAASLPSRARASSIGG